VRRRVLRRSGRVLRASVQLIDFAEQLRRNYEGKLPSAVRRPGCISGYADATGCLLNSLGIKLQGEDAPHLRHTDVEVTGRSPSGPWRDSLHRSRSGLGPASCPVGSHSPGPIDRRTVCIDRIEWRRLKIGIIKQASAPELVYIGTEDRQLLDQAIELGNLAKRTLGFMPYPVFEQAAADSTLLGAVRDGRVVGYALYVLPRQVVKLRQLCVSEAARGQGIARQLVDALSKRHADRYGITLKCRSDFPAHRMWPHLGFSAQGEVPGRSKKRLPLTIWWRDHGHPNLFTYAESLGLLRVAIDLNVFLDLEAKAERRGANESSALIADWLADQIDLVVAVELSRELKRMPDGPERKRLLDAVSRYHPLASDRKAVDALAQHIIHRAKTTNGIDLTLDPHDYSDVLHISEASLAGATVLATRDEKMQEWASGVGDLTNVRVMRPADVILHVDELSRAQAFRPIQLEATGYQLAPVRSRSEPELLTFLHHGNGEQKTQYLELTRRIAADGQRWNRTILRDPDGKPIAFYAMGNIQNEVEVPIFRVAPTRLEQTVTRQLLFQVRDHARREGYRVIRITEPNLTSETQRILHEDGFFRLDNGWIALVIMACANASAVDTLMTSTAQHAGLRLPTLQPRLSPVITADLEHRMWPVKIMDSDLPSFVIPIKHPWSSDLFGLPLTMTPRPNMLGLSREHVYYRSPIPRTPAPARLIWYVTDAPRGGIAAAIACSRLDESLIGKPAALYQRFKHLGVWRQDQIANSANRGLAEALRFADTEIFERPVGWKRLQRLAAAQGQTLALRSRQKISADLFAAIYQEGLPPR
jgi:GNAT superfamily N-acetyltransferase